MLHLHVLEAPLVPSPYLLRIVHEIGDKMKCIDLLFIHAFHRHRDHIHTLRKPLNLFQEAFLILRK